MSALEGSEEGRERGEEEDGRGEESQPVAPDHHTPPYSSSEPVLWMGGAQLNEAAAEAERSPFFFPRFPSCASFPSPPVSVAEELTQEHSEYFYYYTFTPPQQTHSFCFPHIFVNLDTKIGTLRTSFTEISQFKCP